VGCEMEESCFGSLERRTTGRMGAPADAARLQIRMVGSDRPSTPRSTQRDRDQETIWCSEFGRLQDLIAKSSGELIIERAATVGAVAVKTVVMETSERGGSRY